MDNLELVVTHLQIIHTWAEFARERDLQFFTAKHLEDLAQWSEDAITMLKEKEGSCWISVKDKLPTRNANVLWWCVLRDRYMGHVRIGFYEGVTNHNVPEVSCCGPNCIPLYWMPMPNAPTSGNWYYADGERRQNDD